LRAIRSYGNGNPYRYANAYCDSHSYSHTNIDSDGNRHGDGHSHTYRDSDANTYTDADPVHGEMFTHAEAVPDFGWAAYSAASLNTTADAYGLAAPNSATAALAGEW